MSGLLCYCRQGFEPELAAELSARAAFVGIAGYARTQRNDGYVLFVCDEAAQLAARLQWRELIFARQKLVVLAELKGLDPKDRITPILAALDGQPRFGDLWVEHRIRTPANHWPAWPAASEMRCGLHCARPAC